MGNKELEAGARYQVGYGKWAEPNSLKPRLLFEKQIGFLQIQKCRTMGNKQLEVKEADQVGYYEWAEPNCLKLRPFFFKNHLSFQLIRLNLQGLERTQLENLEHQKVGYQKWEESIFIRLRPLFRKVNWFFFSSN